MANIDLSPSRVPLLVKPTSFWQSRRLWSRKKSSRKGWGFWRWENLLVKNWQFLSRPEPGGQQRRLLLQARGGPSSEKTDLGEQDAGPRHQHHDQGQSPHARHLPHPPGHLPLPHHAQPRGAPHLSRRGGGGGGEFPAISLCLEDHNVGVLCQSNTPADHHRGQRQGTYSQVKTVLWFLECWGKNSGKLNVVLYKM